MENKVFLTLSDNYVQHWGFWEAARELIANMLDCENHEFSKHHSQGDRWLSIQTFNGALPEETLLLGNSGKRDDNNSIGKYGEGYKLAFLVLARMGYGIQVRSGLDKWIITLEDHPQIKSQCLCVDICEDYYLPEDTNADSVDIIITNVTQEDFETLNDNFLPTDLTERVDEGDILLDHDGCQIFRYTTDIWEEDREDLNDEGNPKKVFVKGLYVCDLPDDYVFSYNLTPDRIELDRDRGSVNTWNLNYEVASLLEDAGAFELMVQMSEERVPDLHEYYTPCTFKRASTTFLEESAESKVSDVLAELSKNSFLKKHGENAVAVNADLVQSKRDVIKNRIKLSGKTPIEVNKVNFKMLPKELTTVDNLPMITNEAPHTMVKNFLDKNKKHMRSKARRELEKLIEDLILRQ